jgi:CDP-4-dehydro-6-deoxyglucose reductase, E1
MFIFEELAYGFIPNEAGAAFGHEQLNKLELFSRLRTDLFDRHARRLHGHATPMYFIKARVHPEVITTWICYPVHAAPGTGLEPPRTADPPRVGRYLHAGDLLRPRRPAADDAKVDFRVDVNGCPNAERVMRNGLMLPCHPTMTPEDCDYLYQVLDEFIAMNRA